MNEILYILLSQLGIAMLYLLYRLFLARDTFIHAQRATLLCGALFAYLYPLVYINHIPYRMATYVERFNEQYGVELPAFTVRVEQSVHNWGVVDLYMLGVLIGLLVLLVRIGSVLYMLVRSRCDVVQGERVYCPATDVMPFSFGKAIFINAEKYDSAMVRDILLHEKAHVQGVHTIDLLLGELIVILGWFNPFAWMLRSEIQLVIEYLADAAALKHTHSVKEYQYHLLQTVHSNRMPRLFGPHFNYKMLLRRVKKINQRDSHLLRGLLYVVLLPIAFLLIFVAQFSNSLYAYVSDVANYDTVGVESLTDGDVVEWQNDATERAMPQFPGGDRALMQFIASNVSYPSQAIEDNVHGLVMVKFIVDAEGYVTEPQILRGLSPECDAEALRVVSMMPKWKPAVQDGVAVSTEFVLPLSFEQ